MTRITNNLKSIETRYISFIFRIILGAIFIYAGYIKIVDPAGFAMEIDNYRIIPEIITNIFAILIPWLECICGFLLILGVFHRAGSLIIATLTIVFIIMLASALIRDLDINCGCFGTDDAVSIWRIVEDLIFFLMALLIIKGEESFAALENIWR